MRPRLLPLRQLDRAVVMPPRPRNRIPGPALSRQFIADQHLVNRPRAKRLVQLGHAINQRFHDELVGEDFRIVLRYADQRAPTGGRPIRQRHVRFSELRHRRLGRRAQRSLQTRMRRFETAQPVISGPRVELARPQSQRRGRSEILLFHFVRILRHERKRVLRKAARRRQQQPRMIGRFGEQALDQFQTERHGAADQLRIIIAGKGRPRTGQRIAELVDGELANRTARAGDRQQQRRRDHPETSAGARTPASAAQKRRREAVEYSFPSHVGCKSGRFLIPAAGVSNPKFPAPKIAAASRCCSRKSEHLAPPVRLARGVHAASASEPRRAFAPARSAAFRPQKRASCQGGRTTGRSFFTHQMVSGGTRSGCFVWWLRTDVSAA